MGLSRRRVLAWLAGLVTSLSGQGKGEEMRRRKKVIPIPATGYGPEAGVTQPAGSYAFTPGDTSTTIQSAVTAQAAGTTFWFPAGTYPITSSVIPKSGNSFVGQYGAILDASGWSSGDLEAAVFQSINNGISNVTIRNLVLRDGPSYGINAYLTAASWVVDHCEISGFRNGISMGYTSLVSHNYIHHNVGIVDDLTIALRGGGYVMNSAIGTSLIHNEIAYNGQEQKFIYGTTDEESQNYTITGNYVHHNVKDGLWIDGDGAGSVVANNICTDNGRTGITIEIATTVTVQNNLVERNAEEGILISASRSVTCTGNVLRGNLFGINLFLHFARLAEEYPFWTIDLRDNVITGNEVHVPTGGDGGYLSFFGAGDQSPYLTNAKNNQFQSNTYYAPTTTGTWFYWDGDKTFTQWQALPQDSLGTITAE